MGHRCLVLGEEPLATQCADILLDRGHTIVGLVTNAPALADWAQKRSIPVVERARYPEVMQGGDIDVLWSITHPAIIKEDVFTKARVDAINYHDGPLPRYAGIHGSAWALLRGEKKHAIVWHRLAAGIDTGDILERREVDIEDRETSVSLNIKNAALAIESFRALLERMERDQRGRVDGAKQDRSVERLIFSRHDRPEALGLIDWTKSAGEIDRMVRACDFGVWANRFALPKIVLRDQMIAVRECAVVDGAGGAGAVLRADDAQIVVACGGGGALSIPRAPDFSVKAGDSVDAGAIRAAAAAVSRSVAEAEPFWVKRLTALEPPMLPFSTSTGDVQAATALAPGGDDAIAAFAFVIGSLCDKDELHVALDHSALRARVAGASALFEPTVPLVIKIDPTRGLDALASSIRQEIAEIEKRGPYLRDLITRTPALAADKALAGGDLSSIALILCDEGSALTGGPGGEVRAPNVAAGLPPGARVGLRVTGEKIELLVDGIDRSRASALERQIAAVRDKDKREPLARVDLLDADQRKRQLFTWNDTAREFPSDLLIHELFERQADARADDDAIFFEGESLTFGELEARANKLANALRERGARPGVYVAFLLERGFDLVVAMLGIAKSGAAYVPIDPGYPEERARFMIEDARALCVVDDKFMASVAGASSARPARHAGQSSRDVCYAIYTSGSTGKPKGVVLTHRAVVNTLEWVSRTFEIEKSDRLLFVTSPSFDLSVYDVFGALGAGAEVEIASSEVLSEPSLLVEKLVQPGVTIWDSAPPALARLSSFFPKRAPSSTLRLAMMSGDWIPVRLPDELRAIFAHVQPVSFGGATEAAIWSNYHVIGSVDASWKSIPYGRPIQNARYYILDRHMRPVPVGIAGDLYIGGDCLALGYLNRDELTRERFLPDLFVGGGERIYKTGDLARFWADGTMEFLGRADFQVKVRGFRVELGEIEAELRKQPGVHDAVCITRPDASGEKAILAYLVPALASSSPTSGEMDIPKIKAHLTASLPDFMVPSAIVRLDRLPVTSNGKLDRNALPDPALVGEKRDRAPPRTPLEEKLVALWSDVVRAPVGIHDNFFDDIGGHSLLAVVLVTRLKKEHGIDVPLSRILQKPTVAALAESIDHTGARAPAAGKRAAAADDGPLVALNEKGTRPPLVVVAGIGGHVFTFRDLAQRLGPDQPVYAFAALGADGGDDDEILRQSVEQIAAEYHKELVKRGVKGPLVVGGYSFGALVGYELGKRLRSAGERVEALVAFDAFAPGYPEKLPPAERVLAHMQELFKRDMPGRVAYVGERLDNARRRVLTRVGLGVLVAPKVLGDNDALEQRMKHLWVALSAAQSAYRTSGKEPGPLILFRAEKQFQWPATRMDDPTNGWAKVVSGRIDVVTVGGGHLDLFRSDNVDRMAAAIKDAVDDIIDNLAGAHT